METLSKTLAQSVHEAKIEQLRDMENSLKPFYRINPGLKNSFNLYFSWAEENIPTYTMSAWFLNVVIFYIFISSRVVDRGSWVRFIWTLSGEKRSLAIKTLNKIANKIGLSKIQSPYENSDIQRVVSENEWYGDHLFKVKLEHYLSIAKTRNMLEILRYNCTGKYPEDVFKDFEEILEEAEEESTELLLPGNEEKDWYGSLWEEYLVFQDGWKWVKKNTNYSNYESKYGGKGHCGADSDSKYILSLREPTEKQGLYKIRATFSVSDRGMLMQRKGTTWNYRKSGKIRGAIGNQKPKEDTYPYIYALLKKGLKDKTILGIGMSGYLTKNDFEITDLKEDQIEYLEKNGFILKEKKNVSDLIREGELKRVFLLGIIGEGLQDLEDELDQFAFTIKDMRVSYKFRDSFLEKWIENASAHYYQENYGFLDWEDIKRVLSNQLYDYFDNYDILEEEDKFYVLDSYGEKTYTTFGEPLYFDSEYAAHDYIALQVENNIENY